MVPSITHIFVQNYTEQCLKNILEMQELTDIILCVILMRMIKNSHHQLMTVSEVVVINYHQILKHAY